MFDIASAVPTVRECWKCGSRMEPQGEGGTFFVLYCVACKKSRLYSKGGDEK